MFGFIAMLTITFVILMVVSRVIIIKSKGIQAMKFGETDKRDYIIIPFALLFLYLVLSSAFKWPQIGGEIFSSEMLGWIGALLCLIGLLMFFFALWSFGRSFRVGIDEEHPGELVTSGIFARSRNPIYTGFAFILVGVFLLVPNWILLLYIVAGCWLFHRQVILEENALKKMYGGQYIEYCKRVRRYL